MHQSIIGMISAPATSLPPMTDTPSASDELLHELCTTPTEALNITIDIDIKQMRMVIYTFLHGLGAIPDPCSFPDLRHCMLTLTHFFYLSHSHNMDVILEERLQSLCPYCLQKRGCQMCEHCSSSVITPDAKLELLVDTQINKRLYVIILWP
jgi:hypothetical protein